MEQKTRVDAEPDKQEIRITRDFDLPVNLLFRAYTEPDIVSQWMGTSVLKLESRTHGSYRFETTGQDGAVVFAAHGVVHAFVPGRSIIRTFEMENAPFAVQLEFLEFEALTDDTSRLTIQAIYKSAALRDQLLKLPFAQGINMAHHRLQDVAGRLQ